MNFIIFLFSFIFALSTNAIAMNKTLSKEISNIENYLNNITTLNADFIQTSGSGEVRTGSFILKRPGRLRFEYNSSPKDFIVADGSYIHYYDAKLKQRSSTSIDGSLASFFLRKKIEFSKDIKITEFNSNKNTFKLKIVKKKNPLSGSLTLFFNKDPIKIKGWEILDAYGIRTIIKLNNIKYNRKLDNNLFYYYDPERKKLFLNK